MRLFRKQKIGGAIPSEGFSFLQLMAITMKNEKSLQESFPAKCMGIETCHALAVLRGHLEMDNGIHFHTIALLLIFIKISKTQRIMVSYNPGMILKP